MLTNNTNQPAGRTDSPSVMGLLSLRSGPMLCLPHQTMRE